MKQNKNPQFERKHKKSNKLFYLIIFSCFICLFFLTFEVRGSTTAVSMQTSPPLTIAFINGKWFNGKSFKYGDLYSVKGFLVKQKPQQIDQIIDLKGDFVIPPFADAHCHNFYGAYNLKQQVDMYLKDGIFYAKVLMNERSGAVAVADKVNIPTSVDVSYAHGGLTHTNGHGFEIFESLALRIPPVGKNMAENREKISASRLRENDAYFIIDTLEDLQNKWQIILAGKPDFIKINLVGSEKFAEKEKNLSHIVLGDIGINPILVPEIVKKAHQAGLRVSAHVENIYDYRIALKAGVDEMAHMPGYYTSEGVNDEILTLTKEDARETARRGVWVVPAPIALEYEEKPRIDQLLKKNLALLKKYKVKIAFGSDRYGRDAVDDVFYIKSFGVFNNLELLKIWSEFTPQTIFPQRKIGKLINGYETSFLTVGCDPLQDFDCLKKINIRVKQGVLLN